MGDVDLFFVYIQKVLMKYKTKSATPNNTTELQYLDLVNLDSTPQRRVIEPNNTGYLNTAITPVIAPIKARVFLSSN